jgi:hypothetical protein
MKNVIIACKTKITYYLVTFAFKNTVLWGRREEWPHFSSEIFTEQLCSIAFY